MNKTCNHEKVYACYILATYPPQYPWICKKCGEKGIDQPNLFPKEETYDEIVERFKNKGK